jgi:hypothetical protein
MADVPFGQYTHTLTLSLFRAREQLPQQEFSFPERSHRSRGIWCGVARGVPSLAVRSVASISLTPTLSRWERE